MNTKTTIAIFAAVAVLSVALAPTLVTSANAARETTCTNGGSQPKTCDTPPAKCETVKAGQGKGSGEIKSSTDFASC